LTEYDRVSIYKNITINFPMRNFRELLVDISVLAKSDAGTGIQRVVRTILNEWIHTSPKGFKIRPIYSFSENGKLCYRYAHGLKGKIINKSNLSLNDDPVEPILGDIFVGLDLDLIGVTEKENAGIYAYWRRRGIKVSFIVYDLLPYLRPDWFDDGLAKIFPNWLSAVARNADQLVCISESLKNEVSDWIKNNPIARYRPLAIKHFQLSGDLSVSISTSGVSDYEWKILEKLKLKSTFLCVGTIEPRKGHAQILGAFEMLWKSGVDLNLVLVGKKGWMVDRLIKDIQDHPELNNRLFWLTGINDEFLEKLYIFSTCLINASEGEGFGLSIVEAAKYNLPLLVRDIPVFREIAGRNAFYFSGIDPESLSKAIKKWVDLNQGGKIPVSSEIKRLSWNESAKQLLDCILDPSDAGGSCGGK